MLVSLLTLAAFADPDEEDKAPIHYDFAAEVVAPSPMRMRAMGATPGGAQDIAYFRDQVKAGQVPQPEVFTVEGLLSEHDLPIEGSGCSQLLCTAAKAVPVRLSEAADARVLLQLGFSSSMTPESFRRAPLDLVAVVDQSCSMGGEPIETVRESLAELVRDHLGPQDRLSVVLYGSGVTTWLEPARVVDRAALVERVMAIPIDGSTHMEAGLKAGFELARRGGFDGAARVMLFTDERPNTGATDAESFMGLARAASADGIGMTTVGVGAHFGAELAQQISAVRGGNLFFFPDAAEMRKTFEEDFDTMVTELAYDLDLQVDPAPGMRIAGLYGLPGEMVEWTDDGGLRMRVETLFLSKNAGAIYLALAPQDGAVGPTPKEVATVGLSYVPRDGLRANLVDTVRLDRPGQADLGLVRGPLLVEEATVLKQAAIAVHRYNDPETAWQKVRALAQRLEDAGDPSLDGERELVRALEDTLAKLAGRAGEPMARAQRGELDGLPR